MSERFTICFTPDRAFRKLKPKRPVFYFGDFMKYKTENEILEIIESFENGTISRENWRHADHLIVANYYLSKNDFDTALTKMRDGIFKLLRSFKIDLTKEMPYHETLTLFWLKTIDDFRKTKNGSSLFEICNELTEKFEKDYPLRFYSRERLFSDEARTNFIKGDLKS